MFHSARIKLTGWYLLIIMAICLAFSLVIYRVLGNELSRMERTRKLKIERQITEGRWGPTEERLFHLMPIADPELIYEARHRILVKLAVANLGILVIAGVMGYVLAGQTLAPIKEMVDEQNQFISDASHELRTPLTSLKSAMEVYLRDRKATVAQSKTLVKESIQEVDKLDSLSDSLLQLAQFQTQNGKSKFVSVSLLSIANDAARKVNPMAKKKQITIENQFQDINIESDRFGLVDMLVILLDNAIKYSRRGSTVTLNTYKKDGAVVISVTDQGIGIPKKDLVHIFDRFYRSDTARGKDGAGGYGLGLSIAEKIVRSHRGTISAKSVEGQGSTLTVKLPIKQKETRKTSGIFKVV